MLGSSQHKKIESINIHEVLEHIRKLLQPDLPNGVQLQFDYDPSIPSLRADKD